MEPVVRKHRACSTESLIYMKRLLFAELLSIVVCPECGEASIEDSGDRLVCKNCMSAFSMFKNRPVLLRKDNELFPPDAYMENDGVSIKDGGRLNKLKKFLPKKSVNVAKDKMFSRMAFEHGDNGKVVLIVGCGNQTEQLEHYFPDKNTTFVFCDIDKNADVDVFCDSHNLSFRDCSFDGIITTAVLEHVLYPEKVVAEIARVLKPSGFIYSEIPFLQSVHEGAYDFTRFTMSGHRRLLENFEEVDTGIVGGPGTALVWSLCDFFGGLSSNKKISFLLSASARLMFFWLKYFDYLTKDNPHALNAASCTYFYGTKAVNGVSAKEIIARYDGVEIKHI